MTDGTNPVIVPHEFTGPDTGGGRICRYCAGTPLECAHVFGPHCQQAAEAQALLAAPPANPVIVERLARALHRRDDRWSLTPFEALHKDIRKMFDDDAQAALEAMPDVVGLREAMTAYFKALDRYHSIPLMRNRAGAMIDIREAEEKARAALAKVSGVSKPLPDSPPGS